MMVDGLISQRLLDRQRRDVRANYVTTTSILPPFLCD